ncbi:MAG: hypothetical protein ACXW2Q_14010 [Thermoanaerobaculia bacterium]
MRSVRFLAAALCLWPAVVFADSIDRLIPDRFFVGAVEEFITVGGTGLLGAESTMIEISGPLGTHLLEPSAMNAAGTEVTSWVPSEIGSALGHYSSTVVAIDSSSVTRRIGPAFFDVVADPIAAAPLLGMPEVVIAEAQSPAGANVTFSVYGLSFVDPTPTITCDHASGSLFSLGTTRVGCTASDSFGSTSGEFFVVVTDTVAPELHVPASFSTDNPVVTFTVTATDAIDGPLTPACSPASGSTFAEGVTEVVCSVTDSRANTAVGRFNVTVNFAPVLTLPADFSVEATGPNGAMVSYVATAERGTITCTPPSGATFHLGPTIVQCSATGPGGTTTGSFTVTVVDTTPPLIVRITAFPAILWPPNHKMIPVTFQVVAVDLVSSTLVSHITSIISNQSEDGHGDGNTSPDWRITGALTADLRAERAGDSDRIYTITIVTIDESGNQARGTVQVRVGNTKRRSA